MVQHQRQPKNYTTRGGSTCVDWHKKSVWFCWVSFNHYFFARLFFFSFSMWCCPAMSQAIQLSFVEPGWRLFSKYLLRPRRRYALALGFTRQILIRYHQHHHPPPPPPIISFHVLFMVPRVSLPLWLFDLQSSSFFFYFSGTAAPEEWRKLWNNQSETHSHELTEHHRAHWVSNSMAMIKKLLACCWLENVYIRTNMFKYEDAFFLRLIWSKFPRIVLDEEDILAVGLSVLNFYKINMDIGFC
jgi:hypothetical protein